MTHPLRSRVSLAVTAALVAMLAVASPGVEAQADTAGTAVTSEGAGQPAPPSRDKRVIGAVHTDTVSVHLDDGALTLDSKADIDVTGDGVPDLGSRITAQETLFHLAEGSRTTVPALPAYRFLGEAGAPIWMAPQTQNHSLIWPGFSTEDPSLTGRIAGNSLALRLIESSGPGEVELYLQDGATVRRTFSSREQLPAWNIGVPQHTHMNWVFSSEGTYTLTFEATATVDGRVQTAVNDYTFVVGDLDAHRARTATTLTVAPEQVDAGMPVVLTADVAPDSAVGAVQFRAEPSGAVLGSAAVSEGAASLTTAVLPPGEHRLTAEFMPTWSTDFTASTSEPMIVRVEGEEIPRPDADDTVPVTDAELATRPAAEAVTVGIPGKVATPGSTLSLSVPTHAGRWLSVWVPELSPAWRGWVQADLAGAVSIRLPGDAPAGAYRVAARDEGGALVGWDRFILRVQGGGTVAPPRPSAPPASPAPQPAAPTQQCAPGLVLETGHIDAFTVSAGAGRAVLQIKEDVTGHNVLREVESVLLRVKPSAYRSDIPAGTPGAPAGFVLPLTQNPQLIWPGWDTNRTTASGYSDVSIRITSVDGPGRVTLSSQGSFGNIVPILEGGGYQLPGVIREPVPAHTHAQWVFSAEGIYKLRAHAVATDPKTGRTLQTAAHTYVFQVGDVPLGDALCGLGSAGGGDAQAVARAVDEAAAQAVAAAQADAAKESEEESLDSLDGLTALGDDDDENAVLATEGDGVDDTVLVIALAAGGVLVVGGVIGMTAWYLRRLRLDAREVLGSSAGE